MRIGFLWLGCAAAALWLVALPAHAQQWLADRARGQGRGVLVGTFELHPGIGAEIGYDSNVFLSEQPESSAVLRVSPSLYLSTLTGERMQNEQRKVSFRAGISGALKHYFATEQGTDMGVGEDAKLSWNASSIFTLELFQDYKRSIDPFGEPGGVTGAGDEDDYGRNQLGGGTRLQLSTPGKLLKGGLGYRIDWDSFEGGDDNVFDANDSLRHSIGADTSWEFLPKTAVFWNGTFGIHDYIHEDAPGLGIRSNSKSVGNKLGINGGLTEQVGFTIAGGYDAYSSDDGNDSESITAQVEARWRFIQTSSWSLGYDRTLRPSFQGSTMRTDRIKTALGGIFGGVVALGVKAEVSFVDFGEDLTFGTAEDLRERNDTHLLLNLSGEYRFVDWFAVTGEVGYQQNFTDFYIDIMTAPGETSRNYAKYKRFEAWLGLRAFL
jgi:hypothetical protein